MSITVWETKSQTERFALRGRFRSHLPPGIAERSFLELDPLPNDSFKPCVEVLLAVQAGQKCSSARQSRGKSNRFAAAVYVDRRFPGRVVMRFSNYAVVDDVLM
jgi:hypothetical protein